MNGVEASKAVLIEALTILSKDLDDLAVVGGWVPELVFPNKGHIGSLDVDLAIDPRRLKPLTYDSIRKKLLNHGYQQASNMPNRFYRPIKETSLEVKVDLITGDFDDTTEETHVLIQEMAVWKARGIDLAFEFSQAVTIEGVLPEGGHNRIKAKLPTIAAFLCIKAITLSERMKEKDAYDIYFCLDNHPGGYRALAEEFRGKLQNKWISDGIAVLRDKFARIDSIGPVWAAKTAEQATSGTSFDIETEQRRAYELVNALLRAIDELGA